MTYDDGPESFVVNELRKTLFQKDEENSNLKESLKMIKD